MPGKSIKTKWLLGAATAALCMGIAPASWADTLRGDVTDNSGDAPLQGALVKIEELNRTTTTDRFGGYVFNNVPAGDYTLSVSYIGTSAVNQTVTVSGETNVPFRLGDAVSYRESVLVVGQAAAQAGAINQQRASNSIISVIDSDGLGNFPDTTVADSLQRVPGISIENDQGEGRYVSIRGINTDLIGSSINGVRTPSPEDRRGVLLDGVPSDLLDTIEVQKSLTPDVDADSLGGIINLKTISAFDRGGRFIRAKIEGSYNDLTEEWSPKGTFTFSDVFNENLGVAFSINYQDLGIQAHNNETGGPIPSDDFEQRFYDLTRERLGVVFNLDYQLSDSTELYLRTLYNRYADDEVRNKFEFRDLSEEGFTETATGYDINFAEADAEVRLREEVRNIQTYSAGGVTQAGPWTFNYEASYAYGEEDDSNNHDVAFRSGDDDTPGVLSIDLSDPQQPLFSGPGLAALQDPTNYEMDAFEREFTVNEDSEWAAKFDASYDSFVGSIPVTWKGGLKFRDKEKTRDVNLMIWERDDVNLADFITSGAPISNWRLANDMFNWPDAGLTAALRGQFSADELDEDGSNFDSLAEDYTINEQVLATYIMGTLDFGDLTIVGGLRYEDTQTDLLGNLFAEEADPATVAQRNVASDYSNLLPSINARYTFSDQVVGRAAYYAAVVRPGFGEMAPYALLNDDRDELEMGNPNLDAYEADNFDLAIEYYPTNLSVLSAGVFYKDISNPIYEANFDLADVPADVDLSFLAPADLATIEEVSTFINVDNAKVSGVEFNYVQQLDFLGAPFDGLLVSANLTLSESEATLPDGREVPMLKQNDTVWNFSVGYDKGPWDLRVSAAYRGDYLDSLEGVDDDFGFGVIDRYADDHLSVSASAKYEVNNNLQLYVEGKNLTDEPEYYYHGNESRLSQYDEFGWSAVIGARLTY